jgi:hypothetical protein
VVAWGRNVEGQRTVPAGVSGVTAIAAGAFHTVALKSDGTVVAWGYNGFGGVNVPVGLSGVMAITAGAYFNIALKSDGTVVVWGQGDYGQRNVPFGLSEVIAIAAGDIHAVALKSDGIVVAWGGNYYGQMSVPAGLGGVTSIAAGGYHTLALGGTGAPFITSQPLSLILPSWSNVVFNVSADGVAPLSYQWLKNSVTLTGKTNAQLQLTNLRRADSGSYSVIVTNALGSILSSNANLRIMVRQQLAMPNRLPDGRLQFTFRDHDGGELTGTDSPYLGVWATTNISNTNAWVQIWGGVNLTNGAMVFTDEQSPNHRQRFYLIKEVPEPPFPPLPPPPPVGEPPPPGKSP